MACGECGRSFGHHPRCPNFRKEGRVLAVCDLCGEDIVVGEDYYITPDGTVCDDCSEEYYKERMRNEMQIEKVIGEEE